METVEFDVLTKLVNSYTGHVHSNLGDNLFDGLENVEPFNLEEKSISEFGLHDLDNLAEGAAKELNNNLLNASSREYKEDIIKHYLFEFSRFIECIDDKKLDFFEKCRIIKHVVTCGEVTMTCTNQHNIQGALNREMVHFWMAHHLLAHFFFCNIGLWAACFKYELDVNTLAEKLRINLSNLGISSVEGDDNNKNQFPLIFSDERTRKLFEYVTSNIGHSPTDLSFLFNRWKHYDYEKEPLIICSKIEFQNFCERYFKMTISKLKSDSELGSQVDRINKLKTLEKKFNLNYPS